MKLYTIGFTQKRAETFFGLLCRNAIQRVVDIRLSPDGQLAGFAQGKDLPYFLANLADGCRYVHMPVLAPSKEILQAYRAGAGWPDYERRFEALMDERAIPLALDRAEFDASTSCLLCGEPAALQCHRRLVAERLARHWHDVEIIHL